MPPASPAETSLMRMVWISCTSILDSTVYASNASSSPDPSITDQPNQIRNLFIPEV